jgi:hypothetical protein
VTPKTTLTRLNGTDSSSAINWVCTVEKPCPNSILPEYPVMRGMEGRPQRWAVFRSNICSESDRAG